MKLVPGEILLEKYRVLRLIGVGAFGRVYLAEEELSRRKVAIKVLRYDLPELHLEEARERFERESEVWSQLDHPHVVKMYTSGKEGDAICLVLEYMAGGNLRQRIDQDGALPVADALRIGIEIAEALQYVHDHPLDLVHRDVTPRNIMFTADGVAKLMDFGVVQVPGETFTRWAGGEREHPGHPFYRAPEALRSEPLRCSADVYMLGCVIWEMLTGRRYKNRPFGTPSSALRPDVPAEIDRVVKKALLGNANARYQTASEFRAALCAVRNAILQWQRIDEQARLAMKEGDWAEAIELLELLRREDFDKPELDELLERARREMELESLLEDANQALRDKRWKRALKLARALQGERPDFEGLSSVMIAAREGLREEQKRKRRRWPVLLTVWTIALVGLALGFVLAPFFFEVITAPEAMPTREIPMETSGGDASGSFYFTSNRDGKREVYRLDEDGVIRVTYTSGEAESWAPAISPNGSIYFTSDRDGEREVYRLDEEGITQVTFTPGSGESWAPALSPNGSIYFTSNRDGKREVYRINHDGLATVTTTAGGQESWGPAMAPGGSIYFTSDRDGKREVYRLDEEGIARVTFTPGNGESWAPAIAPNGSIYFTSNRDGKRDVYRVNRDGLARVTATAGGHESWAASIAPSGSIHFTSDRNGRREVYRLDGFGTARVTHTPDNHESWLE